MILKENVNWEKIKNNVTKEKPSSFFEITNAEYMEKWISAIDRDWITKDSQITSLGYAVYVMTCLCLDKTSMFGGPLVKSKSASRTLNLETYKIIEINPFEIGYSLGNEGPGFLTVLVRCMKGAGAPKI